MSFMIRILHWWHDHWANNDDDTGPGNCVSGLSDSGRDYRVRSWQSWLSWLLAAGGDLWLADIISTHVNDEYLIKHMLAVNLGIRML